jgi:hypothetical protein
MAREIFGDQTDSRFFLESSKHTAVVDALQQLSDVRLLEKTEFNGDWRPTDVAGELGGDFIPLWEALCKTSVTGDREKLLRLVNRLSQRKAADHAWTEWVDQDALLGELGWSDNKLYAVAKRLEDQHLLEISPIMGPTQASATYRGLVWETRRGLTTEARFIDQLVDEWETTSVEFKRDVQTNTAGEKAELIKDLLGLANTQASGRRWLIIGFDGKTHRYVAPPNSKLNQDHLEQLVSEYAEPSLDVVYQVVDYRGGRVGKIEAVRDRTNLPYRVRKSINADTPGSGKRIEVGDVFIRHNSQTMRATPDEIAVSRQPAGASELRQA